jgi:hypothetical protein
MARATDGCGKTDDPRPRLVSQTEYELRYELAYGDVSLVRRKMLHKRLAELVAERLKREHRGKNRGR